MASVQNPTTLFGGSGRIGGNLDIGGDIDVAGILKDNLDLGDGVSLVFPENSDSQTLANIPVTDSQGNAHSYDLKVGGETVLTISAEADGQGGTQNQRVSIPGDLDVDGQSTEIEDIVTGDISLQDGSGTVQFELDADAQTPFIDLNGNELRNPSSLAGLGITSDTTGLDIGGGSFVTVSQDSIEVNVGRGLVDDGSDNISVDESTDFDFTSQIQFSAGLDTRGSIQDDTDTIWDSANSEIPDAAMGTIANATLANSSIEVTGGDGISAPGSLSLGSSGGVSVVPSDFAGSFISVVDSDLAIQIANGLEGDGSGNIRVNPEQIAGNALEEDTLTSLGVASGAIGSTELENDSVTLNTNNGLSAGSVSLGGSLTIDISGTLTLDSDLETIDGETLWNETSGYIPQGRLQNDSVTINGSDGISAGSVSLGDSLSVGISGNLSLDSNLVAANGEVIWNETQTYIPQGRLENDSLTLNAGDGLKNGSTASLGGSFSLDIEPADFAGSYISDDGTDDLAVQITAGLEGDGTGNIRVSGDSIADGFLSEGTNPHQLSVNLGNGLEGDGASNIRVRADELAGSGLSEAASPYILELTNDSVTLNGNNGLSAGSVSLGGNVSIGIDGPLSLDTDLETSDGTTIWNDVSSYIPQARLENDSVTINTSNGLSAGTVSLGGSVSIGVSGVFSLDTGLETSGGTTIWDSINNYIPQGRLENESLTLTGGTGLKNGGSVSLGSSLTIDVEPSDFAGNFLSDDGGDSLGVQIGFGLTDSSGDITLDESISPTWTSNHTFNSGLTLGGSIDMQSSNSITNLPSPSDAADAARKAYVDGVAQGLNLKDSVAVTDHDQQIDLTSTTDPNPLDGYTLSDGERILLKHQNDATNNGIYDAVDATDPSTWVRSSDMDEDDEVTEGAFTFIRNGTTHANSSYIVTTPDPITLGSTGIEWSQFASAGEIGAGDGISKDGRTLDISVSDFAGNFLSDDGVGDLEVNIGNGIESDGSGNIRINPQNIAGNALEEETTTTLGIADSSIGSTELSNDSLTLNAGDGLKNGSTASLGGSFGLDVEPADFAGTYLSDDGSDNLAVQITNGLESDGSGNIRVSAGTIAGSFLSEGVNPYELGVNVSSGLEDDGTGSLRISGGDIAGSGLSEGANAYQVSLTNNSVTLNGSNGISAGSVSLGGSVNIGISGALSLDTDLQATNGEVIWDESNTYIPQGRLENDNLTISAGDGLSNGGSVSLGDSVSLSINVTDFAGSGIQGDGTGDLELVNDSVTLTSGDGISAGSVSLGGSVTVGVDITDLIGSFISDNGSNDFQVNIGSGLEGDGTDNIRVRGDQIAGSGLTEGGNPYQVDLTNDTVTLNTSNGLSAGSVSLGGSVSIGISGTLSLDSDLEAPNGETLWDESSTYIPNARLESDVFQVVAGDGLKTGGSASLGGSVTVDIEPADFAGAGLTDDGTDDLALVNDSITVNGSNGLNGGTASLGGSLTVGISGALSLDGDLQAVNGEVIWDESASYIPQAQFENDSITINETSVALGGSISISGGAIDLADDEEGLFGTNDDMSIRYDSAADSYVWQDNTNGADRASLDRTTGDMSIEGTLTEGANL